MNIDEENVVYNPLINKFVKITIETGDHSIPIGEFMEDVERVLDDENSVTDIVEKIISTGLLIDDPRSFAYGYVMRSLMEDECPDCRSRRKKIAIETEDATEESIRRYTSRKLETSGKRQLKLSKVILGDFDE